MCVKKFIFSKFAGLQTYSQQLYYQMNSFRGIFQHHFKSLTMLPPYTDLSAMFAHGSVSLQLCLVMWIYLRSLGVSCYDRWVLSEGHKDYFKDWCLMNSQPTYLFLTNLNLMNYGHIIKSM